MASRLEKLRELSQKRPGDPFPLYGLAMELSREGQEEEALEVFQQLVKRHPHYVAAYYHFALLCHRMGEGQRALGIARQGIQAASRQGDTHARRELEELLEQIRAEV